MIRSDKRRDTKGDEQRNTPRKDAGKKKRLDPVRKQKYPIKTNTDE